MLQGRYNLLKINWIKKLLKSHLFIFSLRLLFVLIFFFIISAGLWGSIYRNIATSLTGIIWLTVITLAVVSFGKIWCLVCPWNTIAEWIQKIITLNLSWPSWLRNIYLAIFFLVILVFIEYAYGLSLNPRLVAYVALFILTITIISAVIFKGSPFCRYGCSVGAISGLYALSAPLELRGSDTKKCLGCLTKSCIKVSSQSRRLPTCPVFEYPGKIRVNTYCTLCLKCLKTCPKDNISLNLRPIASDLNKLPFSLKDNPERGFKKRKDEEFLAILLLVLTTFHVFYSSSFGVSFNEFLLSLFGQTWSVGIVILGVVILSLLIFNVMRQVGIAEYSYTLIPLAFSLHLGLVIQRFSLNTHKMLTELSDPFGWNWNLLGIDFTETLQLLPTETIWYNQLIFVICGLFSTLYFLGKIMQRRKTKLHRAFLFSLLLISWSIFSLWLAKS